MILFISHLHEERDMAMLFQQAIESDFGGFVTVFVSSNGRDIMAGEKFLEQIEKHLLECIGAIYLISPKSVDRNWINFELGAIWIRNLIEKKAGRPGIPAFPICHSGSDKGRLPAPMSNLNAIQGNRADDLEFAFRSIQRAFGGRGNLTTNFQELAHKVEQIENIYTIGENLIKLISLLGLKRNEVLSVIEGCRNLGKRQSFYIDVGPRENEIIKEISNLRSGPLKGHLEYKVIGNTGLFMFTGGVSFNGADIRIIVTTDLIIENESLLLQRVK